MPLLIVAAAVILVTVGIWLWWSNRCYELTDFDSIVIGESTLEDVAQIAWCDYLVITSYGGYTYYPMRDGNWIVVRYYGPDHIVWKIEIMSEPD